MKQKTSKLKQVYLAVVEVALSAKLKNTTKKNPKKQNQTEHARDFSGRDMKG